jgi:type II secretory pathway pseudopilin PulG
MNSAPARNKTKGTVLIILMVAVLIMGIGLLVAAEVWDTQIQRENEEELIFRGKQYVEAVRLFQLKHPGTFPKSFEVMIEEKCLRRPFRDPMTAQGEWNLILSTGQATAIAETPAEGETEGQPDQGQAGIVQQVIVARMSDLASIENAMILGVVSSSTQKSIRVYYSQQSYDKWLFFYGQDPNKLPEIIYYGQPAQEEKEE